MARLVVVPDASAVAEAAADRVVAVISGAIEVRGVAHLGLTGGSSAGPLHRALLAPERRTAVDWGRVEFWWGDDRLVGRDDPLSNARDPLASILAPDGGLTVDPRRVHPIPIDEAASLGNDADWIAATYAARIRERVPADATGDPIFDLILLGIGPDGHMLSVFPKSPMLAPDAPLVMAIPAPSHVDPKVPRITLSPRVVTAARAVLLMAAGAGKAELMATLLEGPFDPARLPAQLARGRNATWIIDEAAAARLDQR